MCSHPPRQRQTRNNKRRFSEIDGYGPLNTMQSHPTIVKYRALSINKIFLWELEFMTIKHHYALKKELTSDISLSPLKVHMQLSFNFENENDENNNQKQNTNSTGADQANNNNNNRNTDTSNIINNSNNSNNNNNTAAESKDECDIRLWLVIDHENDRLNKHASFDFGVQYLRKRVNNNNDMSNHQNNNTINVNNNQSMNNMNESIWSELNAKQSHCASGSMWGFQIGKSLNDLKKYCLPKEDKMLFRFDVEFITKCQSQVGYFNHESEIENLSKFMNRIENMWKNSLFCDITIECPIHESNGNCKFCDDFNKMTKLNGDYGFGFAENMNNNNMCKYNKKTVNKKHNNKKLRLKNHQNENNNNNNNNNNNKQKQIKPMNLSINNGDDENDNNNNSNNNNNNEEEQQENESENDDSDIDKITKHNKKKQKTNNSLQLETYLISAHKSVLSSVSSVFYAMLNNHLRERDENHIIISDLCSNTMYNLLHYAYSNRVVNGCDLKSLFAAAEKYQIYDLCHICLEKMQSLICNQTVCDLFVFIQRYKDNHHLNITIMKQFELNLFQFMLENYPQIVKLDSYHSLKTKIESKLTMFMYQKQFGINK